MMKFLVAILFSLLAVPAMALHTADAASSKVLHDGYVPESALVTAEDSLAMEEIRARMAEIRKTRPTVALVLSGGGAKGAAHVGVMRYLETLEIPVDMVLGTRHQHGRSCRGTLCPGIQCG